MILNATDLQVDVYRDATISKTVVQVIHLPSGLTVTSHEKRSQDANRQACLSSIQRILAARVAEGECPLNLSGVRAVKARVEQEIRDFLTEKLTELANETGVFATSVKAESSGWINTHTGKVSLVSVKLDMGTV